MSIWDALMACPNERENVCDTLRDIESIMDDINHLLVKADRLTGMPVDVGKAIDAVGNMVTEVTDLCDEGYAAVEYLNEKEKPA